MLFSTFNYFARNADNMLIGRYLGPVILGYYAFRTELCSIHWKAYPSLRRVLFPAFAKLQDDNDAFVMPICVHGIHCYCYVSNDARALCPCKTCYFPFLSDKWLPIVPAVQIFSIVGLNQSLATTVVIYICQKEEQV